MRIVNKRKFLRMIIILLMLISLILLAFINKSYSNSNMKYKTVYVVKGETLWSIAEKEMEYNKYFQDKDIRNVIFDLKQFNGLDTSDLNEGMNLKIPIY